MNAIGSGKVNQFPSEHRSIVTRFGTKWQIPVVFMSHRKQKCGIIDFKKKGLWMN